VKSGEKRRKIAARGVREIPHIRRLTTSPERSGKRNSACSVRNDRLGVAVGRQAAGAKKRRQDKRNRKLAKRARLETRLIQVQQEAERFVLTPAVDPKVLVERQNICRSKLIRHTNEAGVSKIDRAVPMLSENLLYTSCLR